MFVKKILFFFFLFLFGGLLPFITCKSQVLHTVQRGENLFVISQIYSTTIDAIKKLNNLSNEHLAEGTKLIVPKVNSRTLARFHTILQGESLYKIAQDYNVTITDICRANPDLWTTRAQAGINILIPQISRTKKDTNSTSHDAHSLYTIYKVDTKDTFWNIAQKFGLSIKQLSAANPQVSVPDYTIQIGDSLYIPDKEGTVSKGVPNVTTSEVRHFRIAILFPFLSSNSYIQKQSINYYRGMLLLASDLKKQGLSFDIYAQSLDKISFSSETYKDFMPYTPDIIWSSYLYPQISKLNTISQQYDIPLCIPFVYNGDFVYRNPSLYIIHPPTSYQTVDAVDSYIQKFKSSHTIFIKSTSQSKEQALFVSALTYRLPKQEYSYISNPLSIEKLSQVLQKGKISNIVISATSPKEIEDILSQIASFKKLYPDYSLSIYGSSEWLSSRLLINKLYNLDTYIPTNGFENWSPESWNKFSTLCHSWFGTGIKFSDLKTIKEGYEQTLYMIHKLINKRGVSIKFNGFINASINETKMKRVCSWGGFINRNVKYIHFTPTHKTEITN